MPRAQRAQPDRRGYQAIVGRFLAFRALLATSACSKAWEASPSEPDGRMRTRKPAGVNICTVL